MMTKPDRYLKIVEQVKRCVRSSPDECLPLKHAAAIVQVSPIRLHQIFFDVQGENYGAFARRARLEYACGLMRAFPGWSCTRVAQEAGYSESSDFSRTFKRAFGLSPSRWNRVEPLNLKSERFNYRQESESGSSMITDIGFQDSPSEFAYRVSTDIESESCVAVLPVVDAIQPKNLWRAFDTLEAWLVRFGQLREDRNFMGLSYDSNLDTPSDQIRFELAYPIDPGLKPGSGFTLRTLPERRIARLACQGGVNEFISAWDHLLRVFLPDSGLRFGPGPQVEIYFNDPRQHDMQFWDMDCVIPIQSSQEGTHDWQ